MLERENDIIEAIDRENYMNSLLPNVTFIDLLFFQFSISLSRYYDFEITHIYDAKSYLQIPTFS